MSMRSRVARIAVAVVAASAAVAVAPARAGGLPPTRPAPAAHTHGTVRLAEPTAGPERRSARVGVGARVAAAQRAAYPPAPGEACIEGTWNFHDQAGVARPALSVLAEVVRGTTVVASTITGTYTAHDFGYVLACWDTGGYTQFVRVRFTEQNDSWAVTDLAGTPYSFSTRLYSVADGHTFNFGAQYPSNPAYDRALHAFQEADDLHEWIYEHYAGGGCWSMFESACRRLVIHWQPDSTSGTYWSTSGVYLLPGSPDTLVEPVHEYAHNLMYELYDLTYPDTTNCTRQFFAVTSATCAWVEGWADSIALDVYDTSTWTLNGGATFTLDVTWHDGFGYATGDQVEGRVALALRNLVDGGKAPWDYFGGSELSLITLHQYRPTTLAQAWSARAATGQVVDDRALGSLYQATIDYGFRNPLIPNSVGREFPQAIPDHHYSQEVASTSWKVVAVRPASDTDTDLALYRDRALSSELAHSAYGAGRTDFVAINANSGHSPMQTYYPSVRQYSGTGGYLIQDEVGGRTLGQGSARITVSGQQPVRVWDTYQVAGAPTYYRAVATAAQPAQQLQLAALPADADVVARSASIQGEPAVDGAAATLVYTPSAEGWGGLVLLNDGLTDATVTVYADRTPATGSISINGGGLSTTDPQVTLDLSAADAETGVDRMQISTDGVFDSEPVRHFRATATATLPGLANGTKTVWARFANRAGMWSAPVFDRIVLAAAPVVTSVSPASGGTAGGTVVVVRGTYFGGVTSVRFGTVLATSYTVVGNGRITAVAPRHVAATVQLRVTTDRGVSPAAAASRFTYE